MDIFSLGTIIDDILLLVRNNNISESEDLSRALIAAWVLAYKAAIIKARRDAEDKSEDSVTDTSLNEFLQTKGPLELEFEKSYDGITLFRKKTKDKIPQLFDKDSRNLFSVHDQLGNPIQEMSEERKFFHRFRKYTGGEFTYSYSDGYITIHGADIAHLNYIWIEGLFSDNENTNDDGDLNEEDIKIPGWMIPDIKKNIMEKELAFMLGRVSDDTNNSTLDGIKPQTQYIAGNEK